MISAGELALLRSEAGKSLVDTCVIRRATFTKDAAAGDVETWADLATVACRVAPSSYQQAEREVGGQTAQAVTYVVTLPAGTDVTARDRIAWLGRLFGVVSVVPRTDEITRRVFCGEAL